VFFLVVLSGGLYSEDQAEFWRQIRIKLPFVAMPLALGALTPLSFKELKWILYLYLAVISITGVGVLINYLLHFETINQSFLVGKAIPVPFSHTRYSLMLAFGVLCAFSLPAYHHNELQKAEKWSLIGLGLFLFLLIHILSVRIGLLAVYAALLMLLVHWIISYRQWIKGLSIFALLTVIPMLAYWTLPSLQNKVDYMRYDFQMYQQGVKEDYSDARRFTSIRVGLDIALDHLWLGVGAGDMRQATNDYYRQNFPQVDAQHRKLPHNQFVYTFASNGIPGLLALLMAFILPVFYRRNYTNPLLLGFILIILISFLTEHTLEIQLGTAFCLTLLVLLLNYQKGIRDHVYS
jgi:O-antigen ligase